MPKKLNIDWETVQSRCESGEGYGTVAKSMGIPRQTIAARSRRSGWVIPSPNSGNIAPVKKLKAIKPTDGLIHQAGDSKETCQKIDAIAKEWKSARAGHKNSVRSRLTIMDSLADKIEKIVEETPASTALVKEFKLIAQIAKDLGTTTSALIASERQVFAEEIETVRIQTKNENSVSQEDLDAIDNLVLVRKEGTESEKTA